MNTVDVRRATHADLDRVATTLDLAFRDDPVSSWLFPDPDDRARLHPGMMRLFVESALEVGEVHVAGDAYGAAVWFPVDPAQPDEDEDFVNRLGAACGPYEERLHELLGVMQANHPTAEAHLYLNFLGVRPDMQNRGIGAAMLRHQFRRLDAEGRPAYLESSSPRNIPLYLREGFERIGGFTLPQDGPQMVPMWRKPR
jgi:ribosomal protein S18 acetylase RimI-like enzyme